MDTILKTSLQELVMLVTHSLGHMIPVCYRYGCSPWIRYYR